MVHGVEKYFDISQQNEYLPCPSPLAYVILGKTTARVE